MTWQGISTAEFLAIGFTTDERTSVQAACGGDDSLASLITDAISEWRGVIEAAGYDIDSDTTLVPPSCRRHIIAQVRWQLLVKLSKLQQLQTEERKAAAEFSFFVAVPTMLAAIRLVKAEAFQFQFRFVPSKLRNGPATAFVSAATVPMGSCPPLNTLDAATLEAVPVNVAVMVPAEKFPPASR